MNSEIQKKEVGDTPLITIDWQQSAQPWCHLLCRTRTKLSRKYKASTFSRFHASISRVAQI